MKTLLLAGTKKGFFVFTSTNRHDWQLHGPFQTGREVNHAIYDSRSGRIYATANDSWFGCEVVWSNDLGKSWATAKQNPAFPEKSGLKPERIWHLEPGRPSEPQVLYAGVAPAALFRSDDGGKSWKPINKGLKSQYIPNPEAEVGHCVHRIAQPKARPDLLYMQKHWDVLRSFDAGDTWTEVSGNLPTDFGFVIEVHAHEPETIYVVPIKSDGEHYPLDGKLRVYRSKTGGNEWQEMTKGLPQKDCYVNVLRDAMAVDSLDKCGVYFGTTGGQVYCSADAGDSWSPIVHDLPAVYSVEVQTIP